MINPTWVSATVIALTGVSALGVAYYKVKTHDTIIFKKGGGLNLVTNEACKEHRDNCVDNIKLVIREEIRKQFEENNKKDNLSVILNELKKINKEVE